MGRAIIAIARYFEEQGVSAKNGGSKWHAKTISQILKLNSQKQKKKEGK